MKATRFHHAKFVRWKEVANRTLANYLPFTFCMHYSTSDHREKFHLRLFTFCYFHSIFFFLLVSSFLRHHRRRRRRRRQLHKSFARKQRSFFILCLANAFLYQPKYKFMFHFIRINCALCTNTATTTLTSQMDHQKFWANISNNRRLAFYHSKRNDKRNEKYINKIQTEHNIYAFTSFTLHSPWLWIWIVQCAGCNGQIAFSGPGFHVLLCVC